MKIDNFIINYTVKAYEKDSINDGSSSPSACFLQF